MNIITLFNLNGHENIGWQFKDLTTESTKSTESFFSLWPLWALW